MPLQIRNYLQNFKSSKKYKLLDLFWKDSFPSARRISAMQKLVDINEVTCIKYLKQLLMISFVRRK